MLKWIFLWDFYILHQRIADLIAQNKELSEGWDSDGALESVTIFFGWLLAFI